MTDATEPYQESQSKASASQAGGQKGASEALAKNAAGAAASQPREPETEKARSIREQYLAFARVVVGASALNYLSLYERYASDRPDVQQAAQALDQNLAKLALQAGNAPRVVTQLLAQGPFTQFQTRTLSPEAKQAALPGLLQYAQSTVETAQRQRFVDFASTVTGKVWNYPDLYREHVGSDLTAIQLDQKVAAAALKAGEAPEAIAALLQHSPYARFQREVRQVKPEVLEQYAKGTVAQVQELQSLRPVPSEKAQQRSQSRDRSVDR
ncbi:hypothetical protein [Stenomitos frigidus]|uniref:hypothetical protein n=1 Tax=Stenomitos frigidus TaxID=1886765 RepID=UPI0015E687EA|nr:hypothetical protein [Stenomitos frigidus]